VAIENTGLLSDSLPFRQARVPAAQISSRGFAQPG